MLVNLVKAVAHQTKRILGRWSFPRRVDERRVSGPNIADLVERHETLSTNECS